jgi:hypothetical protein
MGLVEIIKFIEKIVDFSISKYGVFCLATCTFFFPLALFLKCKYEERKNQKTRERAISTLLNDDSYESEQDESLIQISKMSVCDHDILNLLFKERLGIEKDFIVNGKPLFSDNNIIISWQRLRRSYEIYNKSLCNGFWSLFLSNFQKDIYTKVGFIQYFKNKNESKSLILFELINGEYSKIYRVNLKQ